MAPARWLDDDEQRVWRRFLTVHCCLLGQLDAELQTAHHLSLAEYEVLIHLSEAPARSMRMAELAQRLLLSPSGLTRRLDRLVREGVVERRSCPSDRRGSLAALTDAGQRRLETAAPTHVAGVRRYFIEPMSRGELLGFGDALAAIGSRLAPGEPSGAAPPPRPATATAAEDPRPPGR